MEQFTIERKHYSPSPAPDDSARAASSSSSSSSSGGHGHGAAQGFASISPKKSMHKPVSPTLPQSADHLDEDNLLDDNFVSGRRSSTESRGPGGRARRSVSPVRESTGSGGSGGGSGSGGGLGLSDTATMKRTVELLTAHKTSIADMVEMMKEEMEIVQVPTSTTAHTHHSYVAHH
jgi:hypothetical protein